MYHSAKISPAGARKILDAWNRTNGVSAKYGAKKRSVDGIVFDSSKEADRYLDLKMLLKDGVISDLECQKKYELIPSIYEESDEVYKSGPRKGQRKRGKIIERGVDYYADFVYKDRSGKTIVEDVKAYDRKRGKYIETKDFIIKRKLMLWVHGIRIKEV